MTRDPAAGASAPPDPARVDSLVRADQVRALYDRLFVAQSTVFLNTSVVVLVTWERSIPRLLLSWLALLWVIAGARVASGIWYRRSTPTPDDAPRWARLFTVGAALNGVGWGLCPLLLSRGTPVVYLVFLAFVLAGMTAGAALSNASHQPAFVGFAVPALVPVTALFFRSGDRLNLGMAVALVVYGAAVTAISRSGGRALAEAGRLRFRNADLVERLAASAAELERRVAARTADLEASAARERETERQLVSSIRLASLGTLAAAVAHEVNSPLASVGSNLTFVRQELPRAATDQSAHAAVFAALDDAGTGLERVKKIVRYLNDTSRLQLHATAEPVDLHAALDFSIGVAEPAIRARAVLVREYGDVPAVQATHVYLVQVLLDLLQLAAESIPHGGGAADRIRVCTRTDRTTGYAVVEIHGAARVAPGAPAERRWDPAAVSALGSAGFELSMCSDILARFGARLDTHDPEGAGTAFTVWLKPAG